MRRSQATCGNGGANGVRKNKREQPRPLRIKRIAQHLFTRDERKRERKRVEGGLTYRPMVKTNTPKKPKLRALIAYDLETTSIKCGTPKPLYITAFGDEGFFCSKAVNSISELEAVLINRFLIDELNDVRFVAWNGNNFDVYLIAKALLKNPNYILRPYLTRSKNLRGLRIIKRTFDENNFETTNDQKGKSISWEFLDGIAMTVGAATKLEKFLKVFAPDYLKLDAPDWEKETFNARNRKHVEYAERDSEGLYHAMKRAESIVLENFGYPLQPTIGNLGIKIFQTNMPEGVRVSRPTLNAVRAIRKCVMRGGFCFSTRKYRGPVWKYDINQAYAAAMREADLPGGMCYHVKQRSKYAACGIYRLRAENRNNKIPFYYRSIEGESVFGVSEINETWLTSIEIDQLEREGWRVHIYEGYAWEDSFRMKGYVDRLEFLRVGEGRSPSDAQGTMVKAIGNNSYGKTVEQLDGLEIVLSAEAPQDYWPYDEPGAPLQYLWFRFGEIQARPYHQPQVGAFITAHVRMVLRRAIAQAPDQWLYADTDCVVFSKPVSLPISKTVYGKWKVEDENEHYIICTKKVYAKIADIETPGAIKKAKGLNVKRLTLSDFENWYAGKPPQQKQTQRQNFLQVMSGFDMFVDRVKVGQKTPGTPHGDGVPGQA